MPHVTPIVILNGKDVSRFFISCHSEQTANSSKDANKYDLVLANVGGYFFREGVFAPRSWEEQISQESGDFDVAPKHKVTVQVRLTKTGCDVPSVLAGLNNVAVTKTITIFHGEVQKAEADELYLRIEGSCSQGGMTSRIHFGEKYATDHIYTKDTPITTIVDDLLDEFGIPGPRSTEPGSPRHVMPAKDKVDDQNPWLSKSIDFDTAFYEVAQWAQSIYFFDEADEFWFVPATSRAGFSRLTGVILRGSNASNMVGYCNHVDVYGGTINDGDTINERKTHNTIHRWADNKDDQAQYGVLTAPPVLLPNASPERCQEVADNLLQWYRQYKDVPTVKVVNKAPGLLAKVGYQPWNGSMPSVLCSADVQEAVLGEVFGIVTRRIVDISAEAGFTCQLDVTTNLQSVIRPTDAQYMDFYSDPEIEEYGVNYV